jgi:hypothetical protein
MRPTTGRSYSLCGPERLLYDGRVEIELSVVFAPELGEAVREAADKARLSQSEWMAQACQHKLDADRDAAILEDAAHKRRLESLGRYLDEYEAEHGAFTEEELAEASREMGYSWPPEGERT